jgi:hypothetical protein
MVETSQFSGPRGDVKQPQLKIQAQIIGEQCQLANLLPALFAFLGSLLLSIAKRTAVSRPCR